MSTSTPTAPATTPESKAAAYGVLSGCLGFLILMGILPVATLIWALSSLGILGWTVQVLLCLLGVLIVILIFIVGIILLGFLGVAVPTYAIGWALPKVLK